MSYGLHTVVSVLRVKLWMTKGRPPKYASCFSLGNLEIRHPWIKHWSTRLHSFVYIFYKPTLLFSLRAQPFSDLSIFFVESAEVTKPKQLHATKPGRFAVCLFCFYLFSFWVYSSTSPFCTISCLVQSKITQVLSIVIVLSLLGWFLFVHPRLNSGFIRRKFCQSFWFITLVFPSFLQSPVHTSN